MDIQRSLRTVVATGQVRIGADETAKSVEKGEARLVILARNSPHAEGLKGSATEKRVPVHEFEGMGTQLGTACRKPFSVSAMAIVDAGDSDILQLAK